MNIDTNLIVTYLGYVIEVTILIFTGMLIYKLFEQNKNEETKIVKKQALTDQLTGRGNRYMFQQVLDKLILKKKKFAVCFMDLDGFKQINDTMGHDAGVINCII